MALCDPMQYFLTSTGRAGCYVRKDKFDQRLASARSFAPRTRRRLLARTYRQLDLDERRTLFRMVEARTPVGEIAQRLGRHPSTIHRELGRNRFRDGDRGPLRLLPPERPGPRPPTPAA